MVLNDHLHHKLQVALASAEWNVPSVSLPDSNHALSTWVGLDNYTTYPYPLAQAGVQQLYGQPPQFSWEDFQNYDTSDSCLHPVAVSNPSVKVGDQVYVDVQWTSGTNLNFFFEDTTTQSYRAYPESCRYANGGRPAYLLEEHVGRQVSFSSSVTFFSCFLSALVRPGVYDNTYIADGWTTNEFNVAFNGVQYTQTSNLNSSYEGFSVSPINV